MAVTMHAISCATAPPLLTRLTRVAPLLAETRLASRLIAESICGGPTPLYFAIFLP